MISRAVGSNLAAGKAKKFAFIVQGKKKRGYYIRHGRGQSPTPLPGGGGCPEKFCPLGVWKSKKDIRCEAPTNFFADSFCQWQDEIELSLKMAEILSRGFKPW